MISRDDFEHVNNFDYKKMVAHQEYSCGDKIQVRNSHEEPWKVRYFMNYKNNNVGNAICIFEPGDKQYGYTRHTDSNKEMLGVWSFHRSYTEDVIDSVIGVMVGSGALERLPENKFIVDKNKIMEHFKKYNNISMEWFLRAITPKDPDNVPTDIYDKRI